MAPLIRQVGFWLAFALPVTFLPAQEIEPPGDLSPWLKFYQVRTGAGYKDNVFLSNRDEKERAYVTAGGEVLLTRLPVDGPEVQLLLSGDGNLYLPTDPVSTERSVIAMAQAAVNPAPDWRVSLAAQYLHHDQVFDVSATEVDLARVKLQMHAVTLRPGLRRQFGAGNRVELELEGARYFIAAPLDDYWEFGPKLTLSREYGYNSKASLSYQFSHRPYDDRRQTDRAGNSVAGTALAFRRHNLELSLVHHWDEPRRWRTATRLGFLNNEDNGSGFFDFRRYQLVQQLRYRSNPWELKLEARVQYYEFPRQVTPSGSDRHATSLLVSLRLERQLSQALKLYAQLERDALDSNRSLDEYRAHTLGSGVIWEF